MTFPFSFTSKAVTGNNHTAVGLTTLVCGVRHRQASLAVRERIAMSPEQVQAVLTLLKQHPAIAGAAMLSTCNRTECYMVTPNRTEATMALWAAIEAVKQVPQAELAPYAFTLLNEDSILHLMRVAAGLDSLIVGEGQILNQVKDAHAQTGRIGTQHQILDRWFQAAIAVGKRVRTETGIARKDVSVSRAAFQAMQNAHPDWQQKNIAVVGGGRMATLIIQSLQRALPLNQRHQVRLINRSPERLAQMVQATGFTGHTWENAQEVFQQSDILFVATAAPHYLLHSSDLNVEKPYWIADVSVPRNVDPAVAEENRQIILLNTDDLCGSNPLSSVDHHQLQRVAHHMMQEEYQAFYQWKNTLGAVPTITRLRDRVDALRKAKVSKQSAKWQLKETALDEASRQLVNTLLHQPMVQLRQTASPQELARQLEALHHLFDLSDDAQWGS